MPDQPELGGHLSRSGPNRRRSSSTSRSGCRRPYSCPVPRSARCDGAGQSGRRSGLGGFGAAARATRQVVHAEFARTWAAGRVAESRIPSPYPRRRSHPCRHRLRDLAHVGQSSVRNPAHQRPAARPGRLSDDATAARRACRASPPTPHRHPERGDGVLRAGPAATGAAPAGPGPGRSVAHSGISRRPRPSFSRGMSSDQRPGARATVRCAGAIPGPAAAASGPAPATAPSRGPRPTHPPVGRSAVRPRAGADGHQLQPERCRGPPHRGPPSVTTPRTVQARPQ